MDNGDLFMAAKNGNIALARDAIRQGVDVNYMDLEMHYGWADYDAIAVAAKFGHLDVVRVLLQAGAKNKIFGREAIVSGFTDVVRAWVTTIRGAVNQRDEDGETPLMLAAACKNPEIVSLLMDAGADPNALDREGRSALRIAMEKGRMENIALLFPVTETKLRQAADSGEPVMPANRPAPSEEADRMLAQFKSLLKSPAPEQSRREPRNGGSRKRH